MNTYGAKLRFTSFGESHGVGVGCVVDGMPSGVRFDESIIKQKLQKRAGGQNKYQTPRKEEDEIIILSGVFEGYTTGTPIAVLVYNQNQKSKDYSDIKDIFRPAHADFSYFAKYGIRDYRGGGRSSARESVARVIAGAIASMLLDELDISVKSVLCGVGEVDMVGEIDFEYQSGIFAPNKASEELFKKVLDETIAAKDSVGARVLTYASGVMAGLGEVLYDKLDARIASAFMGLNAVKAVEIGNGVYASHIKGSQNNDEFVLKNGKIGTSTNNHGGILGGISTGEDIIIKTHFKPTPSIFLEQNTLDINGVSKAMAIKGRHDPCVGVRGGVVLEAMLSFILADFVLLNASSNIKNIKKIYF